MLATERWDGASDAREGREVLALALVLALAFAGALSFAGPAGFLLPVALLGALAYGTVLVCAMRGRAWALCGILGFALVIPNIGFVDRDLHDTSTLDAQNALKLALWATMSVIALARWRSAAAFLRDGMVGFLAAFALVAIVSTIWSPVRLYTGVGAIGFMGALMFCCVLAADVPRPLLLRTVAIAMATYLAINAVALVASPATAWMEDAIGSRFQGVSTHPNILAKELAALVCLLTPLALAEKRRRLAIGLGVAAIVLMLPTGSRTAIGGILVALVLPFVLDRRARLPIAVAIALVGLGLLVIATGWRPNLEGLVGEASREGDGGDVMTLTGRTELWAFVWDKITLAPLLGHGFIAADAVLSADWWGPPDASVGAHNAWLQSLLMLGIVGTIPFFLAHVAMWRAWIRGSPYMRLLTPFLTILGLTEVEIAAQPVLVTFAVFLLAALAARERSGPSTQATPAP